MIILGIDPGVAITGYGVIQTGKNDMIIYKDAGFIETSKEKIFSNRLEKIYTELSKIIATHKPHVIAIEEVFFCRNTKTAISVGQARGVVLLASAQKNKKIYQYTPLQIKQSICGYGWAKKQEVQERVRVALNLKEIPRPDDVADALAVALCHALAMKNGTKRAEK